MKREPARRNEARARPAKRRTEVQSSGSAYVDDWQEPKPRRYAGCPSKMWFSLAEFASKSRYVSGRELAFAIAKNPGVALPDNFRDYLCRFLRGEIMPPATCQTFNERWDENICDFIERDYQNTIQRIRRKRKAQGGRKSRGEISPYLLAAKEIKSRYPHKFKGAPITVLNILSSWRNGRTS